MTTFQPMPELSAEQLESLRADIKVNGIIVPIVVDQHGRILDGHNRKAIGDALGIPVPSETREVADDDEASELALTLNCARRHLSREQIRQVIARELERRPDDSDRAIARRVGCSPSTVGAVRRGQVSKLDNPSMSAADAEALTGSIREHLTAARESVAALVLEGAKGGVPIPDLITALTRAMRAHQAEHQREVFDVFRVAVYEPVIDALLADAPIMPALAMTLDEQAEIIESIASVGQALRG